MPAHTQACFISTSRAATPRSPADDSQTARRAADGLPAPADRFWRGFNPESRWTGEAALWLGRCYEALGRGGQARPALSRAARLLARSPLPGDRPLARTALSGT
jgi:hypothetical protein